MAALDAGPASSNAVLYFNSNGGGGVEVHVGAAAPNNALNPLGPAQAFFVDPNGGTTATNNPLSKTLIINGNSIIFAVPA
jgi:hypothetical protein